MKKIIFILILFTAYGCIRTPEERQDRREQRRYERHKKRFAYLLKIHPEFIDTTTAVDTTTKDHDFTGNIPSEVDSSAFYNLLSSYCDAKNNKSQVLPGSKDSIIYRERIIRQTIFKECENFHNGTFEIKDQRGERATVTIKGREISVKTTEKIITKTKAIVTACPDCRLTFWQDIKENGIKWLCFFIVGGITFLVIFRRRRNA